MSNYWEPLESLVFSKAVTNKAFAALRSVQSNDLRQARSHIKFGSALVRLSNDVKANSRLKERLEHDTAIRTSVIAHLTSSAFDYPHKHQHSVEEISQVLEDCANDSVTDFNHRAAILDDSQAISDTAICELDDISKSTNTLFEIFYKTTILPCNCKREGTGFRLPDDYWCFLRLDGGLKLLGDDTHCFFGSAVTKRDQESFNWAHIEFQIPRSTVHVLAPEDNVDDGRHGPRTEITDVCRPIKLSFERHGYRLPIRLEGRVPHQKTYRLEPRLSLDCPQSCPPVTLAETLKSRQTLSSKSKIQLAFTLVKSFWRYYESEWMKAMWTRDTICFLPQRNEQQSSIGYHDESKNLFLKLQHSLDELYFPEHDTSVPDSEGEHLYHPYPYLFNLGLLLILLCSDNPLLENATLSRTDDNENINNIILNCITETHDERRSWPVIDLSDNHKATYRGIVQHCIPQLPELRTDRYTTLESRRSTLRDCVVIPMYKLLNGMQDPSETEVNLIKHTKMDHTEARTHIIDDSHMDAQERDSRQWMCSIRNSLLRCAVSNSLSSADAKRPRIAILDTGYDPSSAFIDPGIRNRWDRNKNNASYHWKDFWGKKGDPLDEDGHGTSMLSAIMFLAPFAEIFIARIAGKNSDLREKAVETSVNLENAIRWAAIDQKADIISMSFGWEKEPLVKGKSIIQNVISDVRSKRNQKVLFFAAASNRGGGNPQMYPARYGEIFSIRATNAQGAHQDFNAEFDEDSATLYGTLGVKVPVALRGPEDEEILVDGTSVATVVAASIAAIILGFVKSHERRKDWKVVRKYHGFKRLIDKISTKTGSQQRFITLQQLCWGDYRDKLESFLNDVAYNI